jgi:hypothetical protein
MSRSDKRGTRGTHIVKVLDLLLDELLDEGELLRILQSERHLSPRDIHVRIRILERFEEGKDLPSVPDGLHRVADCHGSTFDLIRSEHRWEIRPAVIYGRDLVREIMSVFAASVPSPPGKVTCTASAHEVVT